MPKDKRERDDVALLREADQTVERMLARISAVVPHARGGVDSTSEGTLQANHSYTIAGLEKALRRSDAGVLVCSLVVLIEPL